MHPTVKPPHHETHVHHRSGWMFIPLIVVILTAAVLIVWKVMLHKDKIRSRARRGSFSGGSGRERPKLRGFTVRNKDSYLARLMRNQAVSNISELPEHGEPPELPPEFEESDQPPPSHSADMVTKSSSKKIAR